MANPVGASASGGIASTFPVKQFDEATPGNLLQSGGNGFVQDSGVSASNPSFLTLNLSALPVADPHQVGQVWNNGGALAISAG